MKNEIMYISYLEIENGFDIVSHIKSININPSEIIITANKIPLKSSDKIFRIDYQLVDLDIITSEFPKAVINKNINIDNDYLRDYLFEIL